LPFLDVLASPSIVAGIVRLRLIVHCLSPWLKVDDLKISR